MTSTKEIAFYFKILFGIRQCTVLVLRALLTALRWVSTTTTQQFGAIRVPCLLLSAFFRPCSRKLLKPCPERIMQTRLSGEAIDFVYKVAIYRAICILYCDRRQRD